MDLSPRTKFYKTPPMRLYSAAEVISAIPPHYQMIKNDLVSGFFQITTNNNHVRHYGIYYKGRQYALLRLPMGHPLAPSILQRLAQRVAAHLHSMYQFAMVSYLDDWLIFAETLPVPQILKELQRLGLTINYKKSVLQPCQRLV
jgi:hypothetical protein